MKFVDLGREYDATVKPAEPSKQGKKNVSYPTLYISGIKGLELSTGEITGTFKGRVVSVSERKKDGDKSEEYSCEIEVRSLATEKSEAPEGGLDEAITKIAEKKQKKS